MDYLVKALLLGIDICHRDADGFGQVHDAEREKRLTEALSRLMICTNSLRPDTLSKMLDSGEEVAQWLADHPQASVVLGYWSVELESPEFDDVDFERYDWPFGLNGAVEDFSKTRNADGWSACWSLG